MGQGLGNTGGEAKQLLFSVFKNAVIIADRGTSGDIVI